MNRSAGLLSWTRFEAPNNSLRRTPLRAAADTYGCLSGQPCDRVANTLSAAPPSLSRSTWPRRQLIGRTEYQERRVNDRGDGSVFLSVRIGSACGLLIGASANGAGSGEERRTVPFSCSRWAHLLSWMHSLANHNRLFPHWQVCSVACCNNHSFAPLTLRCSILSPANA